MLLCIQVKTSRFLNEIIFGVKFSWFRTLELQKANQDTWFNFPKSLKHQLDPLSWSVSFQGINWTDFMASKHLQTQLMYQNVSKLDRTTNRDCRKNENNFFLIFLPTTSCECAESYFKGSFLKFDRSTSLSMWSRFRPRWWVEEWLFEQEVVFNRLFDDRSWWPLLVGWKEVTRSEWFS